MEEGLRIRRVCWQLFNGILYSWDCFCTSLCGRMPHNCLELVLHMHRHVYISFRRWGDFMRFEDCWNGERSSVGSHQIKDAILIFFVSISIYSLFEFSQDISAIKIPKETINISHYLAPIVAINIFFKSICFLSLTYRICTQYPPFLRQH